MTPLPPSLRGLRTQELHASQNQRMFLNNTSFFSSTADDDPTTANSVLGYCLGTLFLLFVCWLNKSPIPDARFHHRRRSAPTERPHDPVEREKRIERSLLVRQVVSADEAGNLELGEIDLEQGEELHSHSSVSGNMSMVEQDENRVACCCICLEPYRVGDKVAWRSVRPTSESGAECLHVFHYECIVPWLQHPKHDDCPSCRATILIQDPTDECDEDDDQEEDAGSWSSVNNSAFVIMHGLISRARRASYNLIGQSFSIPEDNNDASMTSFSEPSPLRKVRSMGEGLFNRSPPSLPSRRRLVRWRAVSLSAVDGGAAAAAAAADEEEEDGDDEEDGILLLQQRSTRLAQLPDPLALRRVASAGPSTPLRRSSSGSANYNNQFPYDSLQGDSRSVREEGRSSASVLLEYPDLSVGASADGILRERTSFSSGTMRHRSSVRSSSHQDSGLSEMISEDNSSEVEYDLRTPQVTRHSVSWTRDILDCDADPIEEDEILIRSSTDAVV